MPSIRTTKASKHTREETPEQLAYRQRELVRARADNLLQREAEALSSMVRENVLKFRIPLSAATSKYHEQKTDPTGIFPARVIH